MTALLGSVTVPRMLPVICCENAIGTNRRAVKQTNSFKRFMCRSPLGPD
jgi:hypothetical protein